MKSNEIEKVVIYTLLAMKYVYIQGTVPVYANAEVRLATRVATS